MLLRSCALLPLFVAGVLAQTYSTNNDVRPRELVEQALDRNPRVRESFLRTNIVVR